ncbi:polycomb group RING finger protein 1-like, partial [Centruroides sculpturatus]|uniref:polycomb group RING finger protein 1-like n=1 Tax=Centruroides sculpturatus TaxID=218467 RepID=UPI000C6ED579
ERKVSIRDLNPHIVCILCAGYFIDATTITECLHTFCKSCIVKYLQTSKFCPMCNVKVHETQPLLNLKADRTLQDIVYKVVPSLWENEMKRRQEFEKARGLKKLQKEENEDNEQDQSEDGKFSSHHYYVHDELIHICIEYVGNKSGVKLPKTKSFVRCSVRAQIYHLKKLIQKLWPEISGKEIEVLCNNKTIPENQCLKRIWLSSWKQQNPPLLLQFTVETHKS